MTIGTHLSEFHGFPIVPINSGTPDALTEPAKQAPRITITYEYDEDDDEGDEIFRAHFARVLAHPDIEQLQALIIGQWSLEMYDEDSSGVVELLTAAAEQLPNLKHLFIGEMTYEENEISWIEQSDLTPVLEAFPQLQSFHVRGSGGLKVGPVNHRHLQTFHIEDGGLSKTVLEQIAGSELPELEELMIYIGQEQYGWDGSADDIKTFVDAVHEKFSKLTRFGLKNMSGALTDQVAPIVANHPLLDRLEGLDLSLGTLGDDGAKALIESDRVKGLKWLDVTHNYMSPAVRQQLEALPPEVAADDDGAEYYDDDHSPENRYSSIGE